MKNTVYLFLLYIAVLNGCLSFRSEFIEVSAYKQSTLINKSGSSIVVTYIGSTGYAEREGVGREEVIFENFTNPSVVVLAADSLFTWRIKYKTEKEDNDFFGFYFPNEDYLQDFYDTVYVDKNGGLQDTVIVVLDTLKLRELDNGFGYYNPEYSEFHLPNFSVIKDTVLIE